MNELKRGARNRGDDKKRIRAIRAAARDIQAHTVELEPDDEDGPTDEEIILDGKSQAEPQPKDTRVSIKAITADTLTVQGYGIVYGGMDLEGETFHPTTEYMLDLVPAKLVMYDHGLGQVKHVIGKTTGVMPNEYGLWVEAELDRHAAYVEQIRELAEKGALGWSSGSVGHLVAREGKSITRWPLIEFSLTPTPAEPRTLGVEVLKSLAEVDATYSALLPEATAVAVDSADGVDTEAAKSEIPVAKESEPMANTPVPMDTQTAEAVVPQPTTPNLSELLEQAAAKAVADFAKAQTPTNAVPVAAPAVIKKLGDTETSSWTAYLRTGDDGGIKHLRSTDGVGYSIKASNNVVYGITTAANAGDTVPVGHYQNIIARLRPLALYNQVGVMMIPGVGTTVNVPVDNEADNGAFVSTAESAAFDRDAPAVSKVAMTLVKYTKKIDLTYELLEDEDSNVMAFLETYVAAGLAATYNSLMITAALAGGTASTAFAAADITPANIVDLLYKVPADYARANMAWVMARATEGHIRGDVVANAFAFTPTPAGIPRPGSTGDIMGVPVYNDPSMPALATGQKSVIVGNWGFMGARIAGEFTFLRDPYARAANGEVILLYYTRCVFAVLQALALHYGTHA